MANIRVDDSIHQKMKELSIKNKNTLTDEYKKALRKHIQEEAQKQILIDSDIEILINKKIDNLGKHLSSYIGKLDRNIYELEALNLLLMQNIREDLYKKYEEDGIIEYIEYKGNQLYRDALKRNREVTNDTRE